MRKLFTGITAAILVVILVFPCNAQDISGKSGILYDAQTERTLFEKNADSRSLIASTTKIMTALIVCEQCNVLDRMRIPKEAVGIEGSSIYLKEGEVLTIQELLYGLMLHSGNDAAVALAIYCGGTVEGFAELMNDKAHALGLKNTHFENPNGLDSPGHYSTAHDMAVLAAYAMQNPIFRQTVSTKTITIGNRSLRNHNKLLWQVDGADGVKTGYTKAAGRILVSSAVQNGRRLVCVTMNAPNDWTDHKKLLESGFATFQTVSIVNAGDCLGYEDLESGQSGKVSLIAQDSFFYPLSDNEKPVIVLPKSGFTYAPVVQGQSAGYAYVCLNECVVGKIPLIYGETIELSPEENKSIWQRLFRG